MLPSFSPSPFLPLTFIPLTLFINVSLEFNEFQGVGSKWFLWNTHSQNLIFVTWVNNRWLITTLYIFFNFCNNKHVPATLCPSSFWKWTVMHEKQSMKHSCCTNAIYFHGFCENTSISPVDMNGDHTAPDLGGLWLLSMCTIPVIDIVLLNMSLISYG